MSQNKPKYIGVACVNLGEFKDFCKKNDLIIQPHKKSAHDEGFLNIYYCLLTKDDAMGIELHELRIPGYVIDENLLNFYRSSVRLQKEKDSVYAPTHKT